ncbi:MAG: spore maturation protein A [Oscillibacter sp.]|nr:spore maturation protein A [Oscillibacter sp.]
MALSWIWVGMAATALVFGALHGTMDAVSAAALEGAASAVELSLAMAGTLCLWSGVMEVLRQSGAADALARAFHPLLRRLLPRASRDGETLAALSANLSANLLGLGNAATPLGIRAAERMAAGCGGVASDELCLLVVLNTASIQLLPTTAAALRSAAGCAAPFDILPAVWLASALSVSVGVLTARLLAGRRRLWC